MTTTPQPQVDIEELEALAKASSASWESSHSGRCWYSIGAMRDALEDDEDGAFVAAANPSAVLAIIAEVRALRAAKLRVHELADCFAGGGSSTMDEIERITR